MDGKLVLSGTVTLAMPGQEVVVAAVPVLDDDYVLTGWIDLSGMPSDAMVRVCLVFTVTEGGAETRLCADYSGAADAAPLHIRAMYLPRWANARITMTLLSGSTFTAGYWIVAVKPDIGIRALLMRRFA